MPSPGRVPERDCCNAVRKGVGANEAIFSWCLGRGYVCRCSGAVGDRLRLDSGEEALRLRNTGGTEPCRKVWALRMLRKSRSTVIAAVNTAIQWYTNAREIVVMTLEGTRTDEPLRSFTTPRDHAQNKNKSNRSHYIKWA